MTGRTRLGLALLLSLVTVTVAHAQTLPTVAPADYGKWESLGQATLSPNGAWLAYGVSRVNEETELRLRRAGAQGIATADSVIAMPNAAGAIFSADSKWMAFSIGVSPSTRERMEKEKKPIRSSAAIRNLLSGKVDTIADVTAIRFSPDARHVVLRRYAAEGKRAADLLVRDLSVGTTTTLGNVMEYAWSEKQPLLAMTIETDGAAGNGVQLFNAATSQLRVLESTPALYRGLTWRAKSSDLAVMRSRADKAFRDTTHVVLAWIGLNTPASVLKTLDPATSSDIGTDMRISEARRPQWSKDGGTIFVGVRPRIAAPDSGKKSTTSAEKISDVQVWHTKDVRLQRAQELQENADLARTLLTAWRPNDGTVTRLGADLMMTTSLLEGSRVAFETDWTPYTWGRMFGRAYSDVWTIDVPTGRRTKAIDKVRYLFGGSPGGSKITWYDGKDYWTHDVTTGARVNLTAKVNADFSNPDYDTPTDLRPSAGFLGWTKGEKNVLIYDKYDVWSVAADGSGGRRLTNGAPEQVVYRYVRVNDADDDGIDMTRPMMLSMYGDHSKKSGFARMAPGRAPETLIFSDERVARLARADSADVYVYSRENFDDAPDLFMGGPSLGSAVQVTALNAFQKNYGWGKSELVNFTSGAGKPLQAALYYPANYDASKKYPMIVYTYELLSQGVHNYVVPSERSYYNKAVWTANGYFVLEPDIVFRDHEPGISVLEAVVPAVRAITARGLVDSTKVGHIGHSWGGYEAAFLPTRTNIFAAGVAGAAITNMLSFNGAVHWAGGAAEYDHWETGQARMAMPPWEDMDAYLRNSPIAKINELKTPVLVEAGDADGTVEWHQSMEYYQSARRAGNTSLVMLLYPGEDHGLRKKENQIDYHRRINEWFGHYLKGEPAPKWITDGMTWLERKAALDAHK